MINLCLFFFRVPWGLRRLPLDPFWSSKIGTWCSCLPDGDKCRSQCLSTKHARQSQAEQTSRITNRSVTSKSLNAFRSVTVTVHGGPHGFEADGPASFWPSDSLQIQSLLPRVRHAGAAERCGWSPGDARRVQNDVAKVHAAGWPALPTVPDLRSQWPPPLPQRWSPRCATGPEPMATHATAQRQIVTCLLESHPRCPTCALKPVTFECEKWGWALARSGSTPKGHAGRSFS